MTDRIGGYSPLPLQPEPTPAPRPVPTPVVDSTLTRDKGSQNGPSIIYPDPRPWQSIEYTHPSGNEFLPVAVLRVGKKYIENAVEGTVSTVQDAFGVVGELSKNYFLNQEERFGTQARSWRRWLEGAPEEAAWKEGLSENQAATVLAIENYIRGGVFSSTYKKGLKKLEGMTNAELNATLQGLARRNSLGDLVFQMEAGSSNLNIEERKALFEQLAGKADGATAAVFFDSLSDLESERAFIAAMQRNAPFSEGGLFAKRVKQQLEELEVYAFVTNDVYRPYGGDKGSQTNKKVLFRTSDGNQLWTSSDSEQLNEDHDGRYTAKAYNFGEKIVVANRGTQETIDWLDNILQGVGMSSKQYRKAVTESRRLKDKYPDKEIVFVGHSLGGGLASAQALEVGEKAYTFNAAALQGLYRGQFKNAERGLIDSFSIEGEVLNSNQDSGLVGIVAAPAKIIVNLLGLNRNFNPLGYSSIFSYTAAGRRTILPPPISASAMDLHGMEPVLGALKKRSDDLNQRLSYWDNND